jgi:hypothetical protein
LYCKENVKVVVQCTREIRSQLCLEDHILQQLFIQLAQSPQYYCEHIHNAVLYRGRPWKGSN